MFNKSFKRKIYGLEIVSLNVVYILFPLLEGPKFWRSPKNWRSPILAPILAPIFWRSPKYWRKNWRSPKKLENLLITVYLNNLI